MTGRTLLGALLLAYIAAATAQSSLPQRNLLIELRTTADRSTTRSESGVAGGPVVIGSGGTVSGNVEIGAQARTRDASSGITQQVVVLNGGQASLRLARAVPWQFFQVLWTAHGAALTPATLWTESAQGATVRPRWPGGDAPATVELSAQSSSADGRTQLLTTVQLPLGQWVTIAGVEDGRSARERGVMSTRDVERRYSEVVQIRVGAP